MNLEDKTLWCDLGVMPYQEVYELQTELAKMREDGRIPDITLQTQHPYEINFGSAIQHNQFSDAFLQEVKNNYGDDYTKENIIEYLSYQGIKFSETSRGGGATSVGPGQYVFYPIVNHPRITGKALDISAYKMAVDKIMFDTLSKFGVPNIEIASGMKGEREKRDVWFTEDGRSYKIGSKGIKIVGDVAYHGFVLYMENEGLKHFDKVNACGYDPSEVSVTSVEKVLGRRIDPVKVISEVKNNLAKQFRYERIIEIPKQELYHLMGMQEVKQYA